MNKYKNEHLIVMQLCSIVILTLFVAASSQAQTITATSANDGRSDTRNELALASHFKHAVAPSALRPLPAGGKRTSFVKGAPASPEALAAMVETTLGGLKFPDGTLQPVAAAAVPLLIVTHDATLQGDGTSASPLGIKLPLNLNGTLNLSGSLTVGSNISTSTISSGSIAAKDIVSSHSLTVNGNINANIISSTNTISSVNNFVSGVLDVGTQLRARGAPSNNAIEASGGDGSTDFPRGGLGVRGTGGKSTTDVAGRGLEGDGGDSDSGTGGVGVGAIGGLSNTGTGGIGVIARGGSSLEGNGGIGVDVAGGFTFDGMGGAAVNATGGSGLSKADGGLAVSALGGSGSTPGHTGGAGIFASGGAGVNGASRGLAGKFVGDVQITGNLSKGGGSFKIDHPLDPANKYLYHSFVESPDMKNIYDGIAQLDERGEAIVTLPDWFDALNRDFRYLLTAIGAPSPNLFIAEKIVGNRFKIAGGQPGLEVSWQVTGIRQDAYANKNRIPVEQDKPERERGFYLHPEAFDQPEEKNVLMVQHPEIMRQIQESREKAQKGKLQ